MTGFFETLVAETDADRDYLFDSPIIRDALRGAVGREQYLAFLAQAYYHVRETVPLLMACVLEGTSIALAGNAAAAVGASLGLPETAFSYLTSHGEVDQEHVKFLESLLNRLDKPEDRGAVVRCARQFFRLYAGIFRSLPPAAEPRLPGMDAPRLQASAN